MLTERGRYIYELAMRLQVLQTERAAATFGRSMGVCCGSRARAVILEDISLAEIELETAIAGTLTVPTRPAFGFGNLGTVHIQHSWGAGPAIGDVVELGSHLDCRG